jgi:phosphonate transport system substrate-binding protein
LASASAWRILPCTLALLAIHVLLLFWNTAIALAADSAIARKMPGDQSLQFGIMPSQSALTLMRAYAPLKSYLEHTLKREIIISTAPSFPEFLRRTSTNEYDFVLTSPHFAKLAEDQHGWIRLARAQGTQRGVFLVEKTSAHQKITDLDGKALAIRDNLALVTLLGEQDLPGKGSPSGRSNISFINSPSYTSAALSVIRGTADAALISEVAFNKLPAADKNHLRVLAHTKTAPNLMLMGNPRLGENDIVHLRETLLHFDNDQNNSAVFFHNTGFKGFDNITEQDMRFATPFVVILQQRLSQGQP